MTKDETARITEHAGKILQQAVREALELKAKLGQYAIVSDSDGKPRRVLARELLKELDAEDKP